MSNTAGGMLSQFIFEKKQSHNLCCEQGVYEQVND